MNLMAPGVALVGLIFSLLLMSAPSTLASSDKCNSAVLTACAAKQDGLLLRAETLAGLSSGLNPSTGKPDSKSYEYKSEYVCSFNAAAAKDACQGTVLACEGNTPAQGQGPPTRLYRREVQANGTASTGWQDFGITCFPELVPGKRGFDIRQVRTAFRNTPFAKPIVHIQPEGNVTLVTLPTYFAVTWPKAGFQPGEIDKATLLGSRIRIRPTLEGYTYFFGDYSSFGPTHSPGGPYPDGDITHAYPKAGTYKTRIDITYGGEYSVDSGPWLPINGTVTTHGSEQLLSVKTARARLVTR
jgi:hypothetical protein